MAAVTILKGDATVLYTFYAPLKASPWFYIGATLLVLGTWVVAFEVFAQRQLFPERATPAAPVPLVGLLRRRDVRHVDRRDARHRGRDGRC